MARALSPEDAERLAGDDGDEPVLDQAAMSEHIQNLLVANALRDAALVQRKKVRKTAGLVLKLKIIDQVIKFMDWEPAEIREWLDTLITYMDLAGLMPGRPDAQPELFPAKDPEDQAREDWFLRGYLAGVTGKGEFGKPPAECPGHHVQDWMSGWGKAQAKNAPSKLAVVK